MSPPAGRPDLPDFARVDLDGLPAYVGNEPGPVQAVLMFRVGQADETLARRGHTHLVEHLALSDSGPSGGVQGQVDLLTTTFEVEGEAQEVGSRLRRIAARLADLPVEALETQRRVLAVEREGAPLGAEGLLLQLVYGLRGPGLAGADELGLRDVGPEALRAHAARWFTAGNAALVLSAPVPGLDALPLPPGPRHPPPPAVPLAARALPAEVTGPGQPLCLAAPVPNGAPAGLLAVLLEREAWSALRAQRGLAYRVEGGWRRVGAGRTLLSLMTDVSGSAAGPAAGLLLDHLDGLADGALDPSALDAARGELMRTVARTPPVALVTGGALRDLLEGPPGSLAERLDELAALGPAEIAEVARQARSALVVALADGASTGRLPPLDRVDRGPVTGVRHEPRRLARQAGTAPVVVGDAGVSALLPDGGHVSVRFDECAAAVEHPDGRLSVMGESGDGVLIDPASLRDGADAVRRARAALPPDRLVSADPRERRLAEAAPRGVRALWAGEGMELAAPLLGLDEPVLLACEAQRGIRGGVLVVTAHRLLFVAKLLAEHVEELPLRAITGLAIRSNHLAPALVVRHESGSVSFGFMTVARAREARDAVDRAVRGR